MSDQAMNQNPIEAPRPPIRFEVLGQPPLKNEAVSVFNTKHGQADRIRALLQAAQRACQEHEFAPIETGAVALDVITCSPAGDATNIVGGIADALEDKPIRAHRTSIDHLSDLATVWLYQTTPAWAHLGQARIDALTAWYWTRQRELRPGVWCTGVRPGGRVVAR